MRHFKIIISTLVFICCLSNSSIAQHDSSIKSQINSYINYIDTLINTDDRQNFIIRSIAEGQISQEVVTTQITGHYNKVDTIRNKINGGWSKYTYQNIKGDTVYKIDYHDNLRKNLYLTFYYKDNQLVYSKLDYQENGVEQTFYRKEEYYFNGQIAYSIKTPNQIDEEYKRRTDINLYLKGNEYYNEFVKDK